MLGVLHSFFTYLALGYTVLFFLAVAFRATLADRFFPEVQHSPLTRPAFRIGQLVLIGVWVSIFILDQWIGGAS